MQYGDLSIDSEDCSKFEGTGGKNQSSRDTASYTAPASGIPSRDVKLFYLRGQVARARTQEQRSTAAAALQAEIDFRAAIDGRMQTIAERLTAAGACELRAGVGDASDVTPLQGTLLPLLLPYDRPSPTSGRCMCTIDQHFFFIIITSTTTTATVANAHSLCPQCYKDAIATFENSCMPMREYASPLPPPRPSPLTQFPTMQPNQSPTQTALHHFNPQPPPFRYGMRHGRFLANVCNVGIDLNEFAKLCASVCA